MDASLITEPMAQLMIRTIEASEIPGGITIPARVSYVVALAHLVRLSCFFAFGMILSIILACLPQAERGTSGVVNDFAGGPSGDEGEAGAAHDRPLAKLTPAQLKDLLHTREQQMREGGHGPGETDQACPSKRKAC